MSSPATTILWTILDTKSQKDPTLSALLLKYAMNYSQDTALEQLMPIKPASFPMMMIRTSASMRVKTSWPSVHHGPWIK